MGVYDGLKQGELQAMCEARGLSKAGANADMMARLEEADATSLLDEALGVDQPPVPLEPVRPAIAPPQEFVVAAAPTPAAPPVVESSARTYTVIFPCPGELSTGMHEEYRLRAYQEAISAGKVPRGGLAAASRTGWKNHNGYRHAVYEVILAR